MATTHGTWSLSAALVTAALTPLGAAQSFEYQDFSDVTGLVLNSHAAQAGTVLRVTPAAGNQLGTAYYAQPVRVATGFDTTFKFQFTALGGGGADGLTFVIHDDPRGTAAIGVAGGEMAYGATPTSPAGTALANSLVFELDTYYSAGEGDLSANEISIHTRGTFDNDNDESYSLAHTSPVANMKDGLVHSVRIHFDAGVLDVHLDDLVTPLISVPYDFAAGGTWIGGGNPGGLNLTAGGEAYVGFTAATGGAWENHDVLSWSWSSSGGPGVTYCFGDLSGSVCPCGNLASGGEGCANSLGPGAMLGSSGSSSVALADLRLTATQLLPFKPSLFVQADDVQSGGNGSPFGDGLRCIGSNALYLQVVFADGAGSASTSIDIVTAGGVAAGQTKAYQLWYRDPLGPCSSGFNATNGLRVPFAP